MVGKTYTLSAARRRRDQPYSTGIGPRAQHGRAAASQPAQPEASLPCRSNNDIGAAGRSLAGHCDLPLRAPPTTGPNVTFTLAAWPGVNANGKVAPDS
jgi:hypothetical protein